MMKKKKIVVSISIFLLLLTIFLGINFFSSKKFYSNLKEYDNDYLFKVTYLITDKNKTDKNVNLKTAVDNFADSGLYSAIQIVPLEKKGDYLFADLNKFVNPSLIADITYYVYTVNNNNGVIVDNCEYDLKNNIIKIPYTYYKNSDEEIPIQLELVSRTTNKKLKSVEVELNEKDILLKNKKIKDNTYTGETKFKLSSFVKSKKDIELYVNGTNQKIDEKYFDYDKKNKIITLNIPSILLRSIDVKINSFNLLNIVNADSTKEVSIDDMNPLELSSEPSSHGKFTVSLTLGSGFFYAGDNSAYFINKYANQGTTINYNPISYSYTYVKPTKSSSSATNKGYGQLSNPDKYFLAPYIVHAQSIFPNAISESSNGALYIALACLDNETPASANYNTITLTLENIAEGIDSSGRNYILYSILGNGHNSQSAYGFIKVTWPAPKENKGFIEIEKKYKGEDIPSTISGVKFWAHPTDDNGNCNWNTHYDSTYDSSSKKFYIGFDTSTKAASLELGTYCVRETADGDANKNYKIKYDNQHSTVVNGNTIDYSLVTISESASETYSSGTTVVTESTNKRLFIGDSRTVGMCVAKGAGDYNTCDFKYNGGTIRTSGDDSYFAATGEGYTWFNDNISTIDNAVKDKDVIILLGVNDITNASLYASKINEKLKTWKDNGANVFFVSVNPVDDSKSANVKNADITAFNNTMKSSLSSDVAYIDTNSTVSFTTTDGIHYTPSTYTAIYDKIVENLKTTTTGGAVKFELIGVENELIKYCVCIKKVDSEGKADLYGPFTFTYKGTQKSTSNTNNKVVFGPYTTWVADTVSESSSTNGVTISNGKKYWANAGSKTVNSNSIKQANYNASTDTYTCPDASEFSDCTPMENTRQYYCIKINKKDASTDENITGAKFTATLGDKKYTSVESTANKGHLSIFVEDNYGEYTISETEVPSGYAPADDFKATPFTLPVLTRSEAEKACLGDNTKDYKDDSYTTHEKDAKEYKLLLNWYKVVEDEKTSVNGAKFKVTKKGTSTALKFSARKDHKDANGDIRSCYQYDANGNITELESTTIASGHVGEVCITGIPKGEYTVTETDPAKYHTFDNDVTRDFKITYESIKFVARDDSANKTNKFINYPTTFEFTKYASNDSDDIYKKLTTEELRKIEFNILDSKGNKVTFIKTADGKYTYEGVTPDKPQGEVTQSLYLDGDRKFYIEHLPEGDYSVKEAANLNGACDCTVDKNCIGFYAPDYKNESDYKFTISDCSNSKSSKEVCSNPGPEKQKLTDKPTEVEFTKSDFYSYEDASDVVDFENDKERNDFDRIIFKVKDANGNYLKFLKIKNVGTCLTDDSYAEYRYVPEEYIQYLSEAEKTLLTEDLYTCGGHIKITHLCRGQKFFIEEVQVPDDSVFILPEKVEDRTREYNIPCCEGDVTKESKTAIINDKGTRVTFQKRDSKYGYLIPDETTTFQVYRCKKGTECHPADGITSDMKLIKFAPRATITDDEEDYGKEVYNAMSDSDVSGGKKFVTDLHPYKGDLILRYLQSGYNYVLLETVAPLNYALPKGRNAETRFTVLNTTVNVEEIDVPNKPTSLLIRKYDEKGNLLPGAEFVIYKVTTYDKNRIPENQEKVALKLKTIRDGLYDAREKTDTNIIKTCKDSELQKCSDINPTLTYDNYISTWTNFSNSVNQNKERVEIREGEALIQYLEYNNYYVIEEVKAPDGYSLPEKTEDRFTIVHIVPESDVVDTEKEFINKPTSFKFYKFDEYDKLIDGAKFKLQKLDDNKKYHDITVTREETEKDVYYKVDKTSKNTIIETKGGSATVYYLEEGQYRILEVEAPPGKELPKKTINVATFFVDSNGNVYGNSIITNKKPTETTTINLPASAELIVNVQTGQERIKYGIIIGSILLLITGLIFIQRKRKK